LASKYAYDPSEHEQFYRYPENSYVQPFKICGNLYYVGNQDAGAHLIDTGDGLILIDTTYPTTSALLVHSIYELGFRIKDIKIILHSHGHFDHFGATNFLKSLTGAKTYLGAEDAFMFRNRPELALIDCNRHSYLELFTPDVEMEDGDEISLGDTVVRIASTPGHTDGTVSFFIDVVDSGKTFTAGMFGGSGLNTLCREFIDAYQLTHSRERFVSSIERLKHEKVDIVLGNHAPQNDTVGKRKKMTQQSCRTNPFIDSTEWLSFLDRIHGGYETMLREEAVGEDQKN
jgi:metallo-beta-lactamase class B